MCTSEIRIFIPDNFSQEDVELYKKIMQDTKVQNECYKQS